MAHAATNIVSYTNYINVSLYHCVLQYCVLLDASNAASFSFALIVIVCLDTAPTSSGTDIVCAQHTDNVAGEAKMS